MGISLKVFRSPRVWLAAFLFFGAANNLRADFITDQYCSGPVVSGICKGTPVNSWAYYRMPGPSDQSFVPQLADIINTKSSGLQGFVRTGDAGVWGPSYAPEDENTIFVFQTYVFSPFTQIISILFGGDDNGSAWVNGIQQGSATILPPQGGLFDLVLPAGVPVELEIAWFNNCCGWSLALVTEDTQTPLDQVATITAVPEPASILLVAIGLAGLAAGANLSNLRGQSPFLILFKRFSKQRNCGC
jgi:hypothetical protein